MMYFSALQVRSGLLFGNGVYGMKCCQVVVEKEKEMKRSFSWVFEKYWKIFSIYDKKVLRKVGMYFGSNVHIALSEPSLDYKGGTKMYLE